MSLDIQRTQTVYKFYEIQPGPTLIAPFQYNRYHKPTRGTIIKSNRRSKTVTVREYKKECVERGIHTFTSLTQLKKYVAKHYPDNHIAIVALEASIRDLVAVGKFDNCGNAVYHKVKFDSIILVTYQGKNITKQYIK